MELVLKSLQLTNFKGVKDLKIDFTENTVISGDNATGKTTIFDAYSWLLWDKDSQNRKDFDIKPYAENGEVRHGIESTVTGVLSVDGEDLELSKTYKEIWTKKRGQIEEVFTGNTTEYYINSVPVKKSQYNMSIETIITEDEFNLLSNPMYFNNILDKKERRKVLLEMITDVSKEEVIAVYKDLKALNLDTYKLEELRAMAKLSAKKTNEEIESLPIRIDELEKSKNDYDFTELEKEKEETEKAIEDLDRVISKSSQSANVVTEKNNLIQNKIDEMRKIKAKTDDLNEANRRQAEREYNEKISKFEDKKEDLKRTLRRKEDSLYDLKKDIAYNEKNLDDTKTMLSTLRDKWVVENEKQFDGSLICPTCKREFEEDKKGEILADFNRHKSNNLMKIEEQAEVTKEVISGTETKLEELKKEKEKIESEIVEIELEYKSLGKFKEEKPIVAEELYPQKYFTLEKEIEAIMEELKAISNNDNSSLIEEKRQLQSKLNDVIRKLGLKENNKFIDEKIQSYIKQEKELAKVYEDQQHRIFLCDEYVRIYTSLVQDKINDLFETVDFRLFEKQVNGELKETCESTVNGVPYSSVNNAGRINAGLDVINTLSKHFDKKIPIFVDNAESVNNLVEVQGQTVKLYVSKDKKLKIKGE